MENKEENLFEDEVNKTEDDSKETEDSVEESAKSEEESEEPIESVGLSNKPKGRREYDKIQLDEEFPKEGMVLTIESAELQQVYNDSEVHTSSFGEYYKTKLIINFEEEFNDRKLRELLPSVFWRKENDTVVPNLPKACESEEDLKDNFTSKLAKFRYIYMRAFNKPEDQSDFDFIKDLVGKKVHVTKYIGKYNNKKFALLNIDKFIVE